MEENSLVALTEEYLMSKIYVIRGVQVMLDVDLAVIYGYTTKNFNRQVKNNIDRFDDDFRFQLTDIEVNILRCKTAPQVGAALDTFLMLSRSWGFMRL